VSAPRAGRERDTRRALRERESILDRARRDASSARPTTEHTRRVS
jgi:hypothetical protein